MRFRLLALAPALIVVVAACSGSGSTPSPSVAPSSASAAASANPAAQAIEVKLTDALKMDPAQMTVKAGQPIRFVVTNTGANAHEFYLGDEAAQEAHEMEMMASMAPMSMDETSGFTLMPGETKELTYTFPNAGTFLSGCHETGHYAAGMKAAITVTE